MPENENENENENMYLKPRVSPFVLHPTYRQIVPKEQRYTSNRGMYTHATNKYSYFRGDFGRDVLYRLSGKIDRYRIITEGNPGDYDFSSVRNSLFGLYRDYVSCAYMITSDPYRSLDDYARFVATYLAVIHVCKFLKIQCVPNIPNLPKDFKAIFIRSVKAYREGVSQNAG